MSVLDVQSHVRLSRFVHLVEVDDATTAVYNSLSQAVIYVPTEVAEAIRKLAVTTSEEFVRRYFPGYTEGALDLLRQLWLLRMLVEENESEMAEVELLRHILETPQIMILYLILTDICNIGCKYCFFEGGIPEGHEFSMMGFETARMGVDLFARSINREILDEGVDRPMIIFYGGEALLNWSVAKQILEYITQQKASGVLPVNTGITLNTNELFLRTR